MDKQHQEKWVIVAAPHGAELAAIVVGQLETEGIPTIMDRTATAPGLPGIVGIHSQVNIYVPEEYYDEALAIIGTDYLPG